ncbi:aluminum-activated malate transporter 9 [Hibiscus syriacus]|uniref:Aluminum-activated malate transporter 9 n=1 Tax=Hibiscus syriacus TaxID=106335 RepID=A0A6A3B1R2_HIBSY|nr:aluminum-activated malate transporter 9 [Hibiscus syriacus]
MGNTSSMLTQYEIEEVRVLQLSMFCELDGNGCISSDEMLSVPEFAMNPVFKRVVEMVDGFNFKDFVAFLSAFSPKANQYQKAQREASN